jgi:hypothetical protein
MRSTLNGTFAAIVAVSLLAIAGCTTGQSSAGGSPAPGLVAPSLAASPVTSPPSPSTSTEVLAVHDGPLAAGRYRMEFWDDCGIPPAAGCSPSPAHDALRMTFTLPDGWAGVGTDSIWLAEKGNSGPDGAGLLFGRGAWLLSDPCVQPAQPIVPDIAVGPSADDFASAIADHPLLDATQPVEVTLAGYPGTYIDLQLPADISMCELYRPWYPGIYAQGSSHLWHLWILEVDGLRIVVQSTDYPGTSAKHRSELAAIVDSIAIEP